MLLLSLPVCWTWIEHLCVGLSLPLSPGSHPLPLAVTDAVSLRSSVLPCLLALFHCHLKMLTSWLSGLSAFIGSALPAGYSPNSLIWPASPACFPLPVLALPACLCPLICSFPHPLNVAALELFWCVLSTQLGILSPLQPLLCLCKSY